MWKSLSAHSAWPIAWWKLRPAIVSCANSGFTPTISGCVERLDEVQRVADGRQEDVPARLVGLGLHREAQVVAVVEHVVAEDVDRLAVALQRVARVLGDADLGALAAAPEDVDLGVELGGGVDEAHRLADRRAPHAAVVGRERAVLERRVAEQVRRRHADAHAGLVQRVLEARDDLVLLGVAATPSGSGRRRAARRPTRRARPVCGPSRPDRRRFAGRPAERITAGVAYGPQTEREAMAGAARLATRSSRSTRTCFDRGQSG